MGKIQESPTLKIHEVIKQWNLNQTLFNTKFPDQKQKVTIPKFILKKDIKDKLSNIK